jgi:hypothetical protein
VNHGERATFSEMNRIVELFLKPSTTLPPVCEKSKVRRKELTKRNHGNSIDSKKMLNLLRVKVCVTGEIQHVFFIVLRVDEKNADRVLAKTYLQSFVS